MHTHAYGCVPGTTRYYVHAYILYILHVLYVLYMLYIVYILYILVPYRWGRFYRVQ